MLTLYILRCSDKKCRVNLFTITTRLMRHTPVIQEVNFRYIYLKHFVAQHAVTQSRRRSNCVGDGDTHHKFTICSVSVQKPPSAGQTQRLKCCVLSIGIWNDLE